MEMLYTCYRNDIKIGTGAVSAEQRQQHRRQHRTGIAGLRDDPPGVREKPRALSVCVTATTSAPGRRSTKLANIL